MKKFISLFLCMMLIFAIVPISVVNAITTPVLTVANITAKQGDTVKVEISIDNNPGIMGMAFCITYDAKALAYVDYEEGYLSDYNILNHANSGEISFVNIESTDLSNNDVLLTLVFKVNDNAQVGEYEIGIVNKNPEKYGDSLADCFSNSKEEVIVPTVNKGCVKVCDYIIGDVNGDGKVNTRDNAVLIQYLNGWDITIDEKVADVNGDGKVNTRDNALLIQYLNGWDVKLG